MAAMANDILNEVLAGLKSLPTQQLMIAAFCLALVFVIVLSLIVRGGGSRYNDVVLLLGPPEAGKTAILTTLAYGQTMPTHMSMEANSVSVNLDNKKSVRFVDVPGHARLRDRYKEILPTAKAVVFVVDASTITRNGAAVAEHLHQIFHSITTLPPTKATPSVLILAHKADLLPNASASLSSDTSKSSVAITRVRTILERELEKRRTSQIGSVNIEGMGGDEEGTEMGGLDTRSAGGFKFSEWEGGEIELHGTYVQLGRISSEKDEKSEDGLLAIREWLADNFS